MQLEPANAANAFKDSIDFTLESAISAANLAVNAAHALGSALTFLAIAIYIY
jgi:hypothetical protein